MNTQWELYFLRREIERQKIQKQRKKKRRIWIAGISGLLALVFLAGGISMVRFIEVIMEIEARSGSV